ncbi:MAG: hypothetical protein KGH59_01790 [Candidatus Micrarchaeota archaeon]|nr:hypothetical protein [Candidatus Micrarchaeota archaeon]MDE1804495.1 hypothetical protein [Candidatus Micrarchaeota archaeon]MDE1846448.1 hypothetical protein [Candidatus Micrarchaeota archaeon]
MGGKGGSRHLKRLASPSYMKVRRKDSKFMLRPSPGRHTKEGSIAISTFLREKIGVASSAAEARKVIIAGKVEINGRVRRSYKYPIGFGDIVRIIPSNESYIIAAGKYGAFEPKKVEKDAKRTLKVVGKYIAEGKKQMIRLNNGNIFNFDKEVKVNDSVIVDQRKISKVLKFEKGASCIVIKGMHAPESGKISEIKEGTALRDATVTIQGKGGSFETIVENIIVTGE